MLFLALFVVANLAKAGFAQTNETEIIDDEVNLLPTCGLNCITAAVIAVGCGRDDYGCICGPLKDAIKEHAIPCITSSCSTSDALKIQPITLQICVIEASLQNSSSVTSSNGTTAQASSTLATTTSNLSTTIVRSSASASPTKNTTSSAARSSSTSTSRPSSTSASPGSSSTTASSQHTSNSLSKGAIVGIAVGASLGGLLLLVVIAFLAFGYRKRGRDLKHLAALSRGDGKVEGRHEMGDENNQPSNAQNDVT